VRRTILSVMVGVVLAGSAAAETRVGVTAELLSGLASGPHLESWTLAPAGSAELSLRNTGSRLVRAELLLRFAAGAPSGAPELRRLYARAALGETLVTVGRTRSSWGAGLALNAGDIIFGSSSVDFSLRAADPRTETAWLTSVEIPFGDFSFVEVIALAGSPDLTNPSAPVPPAVDETSAGGRVNLAAGNATIQAGYLYRGDRIAGLGGTGHHAYLTAEGFVPVNWHVSASARTPVGRWDAATVRESLTVSVGAFDDAALPADRALSWQVEAIVRALGSFEPRAGAGAGDYAVFVFPGVGLTPRAGLSVALSSLVSPVDLSSTSTLSVSWSIYEALTLLGYASVAAGEPDDLFSIEQPGGLSFVAGARYVY